MHCHRNSVISAQRIDPKTNGLYYYRARHYMPAWGRFLQADPIGYSGGSNLYGYVGNDPLNFTDPNGLVKDFVSGAADNFYNQTLLKGARDIGDLLNNPSQIPNAIATTAPGLGPVAELPQAISGAVGAIRAIGSLGTSTPENLSNSGGDATAAQAPDPNKLNHIFNNPGHNLDTVVQQFGGQPAAYNAIEQAVVNKLGSGTGTYTTIVDVGGTNVTVSGAYVNGIPRIGTAFIP